jgi:3-mercaptopyruvate sulfurtransferase SseA
MPDDIPASPNIVYAKSGWAGFGDWLGTDRHHGGWRSFKDARAFVRKLKLKGQKEWGAYCKSGKRPNDIPVGVTKVYANAGWAGMGDWLGTGRLNNADRRFRSFRDARAFVRSLGLKNQRQWHAYCKSGKKPNDIPSNANQVYDSWISWPDWLGHGFRRGGWP